MQTAGQPHASGAYRTRTNRATIAEVRGVASYNRSPRTRICPKNQRAIHRYFHCPVEPAGRKSATSHGEILR